MLGCKKKALRRIQMVCVLLAAGLILGMVAPRTMMPVSAASSLSELEDRQSELKSQKEANDKKLDELKADKEKQEEYKKTLNNQIEVIQQEIDSYNLEITQLNDKISEKEEEISDKQASIDENFDKLKERHDVPIIAMAVNSMSQRDVYHILREALYEFPVSTININMPGWVSVLDDDHWLKKSVNETIASSMASVAKLREVEKITEILNENEYIESSNIADIDTGEGSVNVEISTVNGLYQTILKEIIGVEIKDKGELIALMQEFSKAKKEYDTIASALKMVKQTGYGFASASLDDISLSKPEIVKQGSRYGVRLKAVAPSIHMIKVDVESSFEPIIGSKEQSEELVRYLLRDEGKDNDSIWESDIFGRKLSDLIRDGLNVKLSMIPEAARARLQDILTKLVNKGKGNVIAIVL